MKYTVLGQTGVRVSNIGLGGGQYLYNKAADKQSLIKLVRYAYDKGITVFDTAPLYESEDIFGEGLKGLDRSSFVLATKVGHYPDKRVVAGDTTTEPGMVFDFSAKCTEESVKRSLELLQTSYIDLIQVHDLEYGGDRAVDIVVNETLPALQKCREQGLVRFIGLASYHLPKMKQIIERSKVKVDTVLNHSCLTLIDQELADYMPFFKERGIGVINGSPLAHGLLMQKPLPPWMQADPDLKAASGEAVKITQEAGMSIERLAIKYSAKRCEELGIEVFLTGPGSIARLDENIGLIEEPLTKEEAEMCQRLRRDIFEKLPPDQRNWLGNYVIAFNAKLGKK